MTLTHERFNNTNECIQYYLNEHNKNSFCAITESNIISWESNKGLFCIRQVGSVGIKTLRTFKKRYGKYEVNS